MADNDKQSDGAFRWWEFYAIRYGMGTVVGGVVFFFLCFTNPALKPLLFGADTGNLDGTRLALFTAYGLAYCYIASAPILVFHAGRFLFKLQSTKAEIIKRAAIIFSIPIALVAFSFWRTWSEPFSTQLFYAAATFLCALIVWLQLAVVALTLVGSQAMYDFYTGLAERRKSAPSCLVESYRHLREHGNSFLIVLLEFTLAIVLFAAGNFDYVSTGKVAPKESLVIPYLLVLLVWFSPAASIWFVGTIFERRFRDSPP